MMIEIRGIGFGNKGAELMLAAVVAHLRDLDKEVCLVSPSSAGSFADRSRYGLFQVMDFRRAGRTGWIIESLFHSGYRSRYGLVARSEVDAILDVSGYALGDSWDPSHIENKATEYESLRKMGKIVILLPQAIGPLETARVRVATARVLAAAHLVFARDSESLEIARSAVPPGDHIYQSPDFTNLLRGVVPPGFRREEGLVALIPNTKMLVGGRGMGVEEYIALFAGAAAMARKSGLSPVIILHEVKGDRELAVRIREACKVPPPILEHEDPVALKGIVGTCAVTIGSRFHGLVSALSQAVPSVGTSWSHKYKHLFSDYGVEEFLLPAGGGARAGLALLDRLVEREARDDVRRRLTERLELQKVLARGMWGRVGSLLASRQNPPEHGRP